MGHRFHSNCLLGLGQVELNEEETRHVAVSRLRLGEKIVLFNGDGKDYLATFLGMQRRVAHFVIEDIVLNNNESLRQIIIGAPLPKGDREQFMIEKLVELGVAHFIPLETERSKIHPESKRLDRLKKHVIEASKQCGRSRLMKISDLTKWKVFIDAKQDNQSGWVAHGPREEQPFLRKANYAEKLVYGAVGPEGGLTEREVEQAAAAGWNIVELGKRILRIETAAMIMAWELGRKSEVLNQERPVG